MDRRINEDPMGRGYSVSDFLDERLAERIRKFFGGSIELAENGHHAAGVTGISDPAKRVKVQPDRILPTEAPGGHDAESIARALRQYFREVTLCRLHGSAVGEDRSDYAYDIGFKSTRRVGILLNNPMDTILSFGGETSSSSRPDPAVASRLRRLEGFLPQLHFVAKKLHEPPTKETNDKKSEGEKATEKDPRKPKPVDSGGRTHECDLNLRIIVDDKGLLRVLQIFGSTIRIHFSRRLIKPVRRNSQGMYLPLQGRVSAGLEHRVITLARWHPPRISEPLDCGNALVQVSGRKMIAKLKTVTLGGSFAAPRLIFDHVELF